MVACCFCERTENQVTHLVQGPNLFICDICVDACIDTLATKDHGWRERQIDYLLRLRTEEDKSCVPPQGQLDPDPSRNACSVIVSHPANLLA